MKLCQFCKTPFEGKKSIAIYCSKKCGDAVCHAKRPKVVKVSKLCVICNKSFMPSGSRNDQKCCSAPCRSKRYRDSHPEWYQQMLAIHRPYMNSYYKKNRKKMNKVTLARHDQTKFGGNKTSVLKRDKNKCFICLKKSPLIIHHIDGSGKSTTPNNMMNNLVTLCRGCHASVHFGKLISYFDSIYL